MLPTLIAAVLGLTCQPTRLLVMSRIRRRADSSLSAAIRVSPPPTRLPGFDLPLPVHIPGAVCRSTRIIPFTKHIVGGISRSANHLFEGFSFRKCETRQGRRRKGQYSPGSVSQRRRARAVPVSAAPFTGTGRPGRASRSGGGGTPVSAPLPAAGARSVPAPQTPAARAVSRRRRPACREPLPQRPHLPRLTFPDSRVLPERGRRFNGPRGLFARATRQRPLTSRPLATGCRIAWPANCGACEATSTRCRPCLSVTHRHVLPPPASFAK
jgi:hypothetical protein